jgi:DoxX-like family
MPNKPIIKNILRIGIALVWLINGLFCKLLNLVPRHQLIVSQILGEEYANIITKAIGISEILMFVWIISRIKPRLCAITQIIVIATMNIVEFILVPDLLLFGKLNIVMAAVLIVAIFINEFLLSKPNYKNLQ